MPRSAILSTLLVLACGSVLGASTNAWEQTDRYVPPDFEAYFPDDPAGGERLTQLERTRVLETLAADEMVAAVRNGLRRTQSHKLSILRTIGNRFIWNRTPQHPGAIELMYHAASYSAERDPESTRHFAIYFGPSVVQPKTPNILRALTEICMRTDDPNILSRVSWGVQSQRDECLRFLEPFLRSDDETVRAKAQRVERMLKKELEPFAWAREEARKRAEARYRSELPDIKRTLLEGSSKERWDVIVKVFRERITLIMDDSFVPAFAACARDENPDIRQNVAKLVGEDWIWHATEQSPTAIALLLEMTRDPDRQVRYDAVYHGLSTVRSKSDELIHRLVEMYLKDPVSDIRSRIDWGLRLGPEPDRAKAKAVVAEYLDDPDPKVAAAAEEWFRVWTQVQAANADDAAKSMRLGEVQEALRKRLDAPFRPFTVRLAGGQALFLSKRQSLAIGAEILVIIEAQDCVRTIELRQIAAVEDLPAKAERR